MRLELARDLAAITEEEREATVASLTAEYRTHANGALGGPALP